MPAPPALAPAPRPLPSAPGRTAVVCGIGAALPARVMDNDEVTRVGALDTGDAWIRSRTGIARRHRADPATSTGDLAEAAGRAALRSAGGTPPDMLLLATTTPDRRCPATAPEVAYRLGAGGAPAFDLAAVCSGFVYAVTVATALVGAGVCARPLVVGAETYSTIVDPHDRDTAVVFGDGAGAVLLRAGDPGEPGAVVAADLGADGSGSDLIAIAAGGSRAPFAPSLPRHERYLRMRGREVYRQAVRRMTQSSRRSCNEPAGRRRRSVRSSATRPTSASSTRSPTGSASRPGTASATCARSATRPPPPSPWRSPTPRPADP
jgi:3-oxoacyl-[acyl-carrier-protein] synthase-3